MTALLLTASAAKGQNEQIVKTGLNFGPLPAVAYDADKGFQYGAILQIFDYGDGKNYPNYDNKTYFEYSRFTKGSQLIQVQHDNKNLIPGIRWSSALKINIDKAFDFYGFNGYKSFYNHERIAMGINGQDFRFNPFYRMKKNEFSFKSDFLGTINPNLKWEAGIFARHFDIGDIDYDSINKGKEDVDMYPTSYPTLFGLFKECRVISEEEADGGFSSGLRLGMVYDSRDKEGAPTKGIWAEGHITAALPGISKIPYYRYSLTMRQYFPLVKHDVLTFAYRLNYEGNFGKDAPFYAVPYLTAMGEQGDFDGMGGYRTTRGIMRDRVFGLDMATYVLELRWRPVSFTMLNQNFALGLSAFSDGAMVTRMMPIDAYYPPTFGFTTQRSVKDDPMFNYHDERPHVTVGSGLRLIMNENFIVAFEYGTPITHFMKNSPLYNQDGTGAFYINLGYLF